MFVNEKGYRNINSIINHTTKQIAIEKKMDSIEISDNTEFLGLSEFVDTNLMGSLRAQLDWNQTSVLSNKKIGFDKSIIKLVKFFRSYITDNNINFVFIDLVSPFTSLECRVLEKVCDDLGVKKLISSKASLYGRLEIFDNTKRISRIAESKYKLIVQNGLNDIEQEKLDYFLKSYRIRKQKFHGDIWIKKLLKENTSGHKIFWNSIKKLKRRLIQKITNDLKIEHRNLKEFSETPYFIFFPNKKNNHRTFNCSPFHSNYAALIQAISISLPLGYCLLVKDHPHQIKKEPNSDLVSAIKSLDNCHYLSFETDYYDLIDNAVGVFSAASTTAIESLIARKHVIMFGSEPYIYGSDTKVPVHRVSNLEELPNIIKNCINRPIESEIIDAYLYSLIDSSSSIHQDSQENDFTSNNDDDKQKEYACIAQMIKKLIQ